jgi:alpha-amylase
MNSRSTNATAKRNLVLYFQVHQPNRLKDLRFFDIGSGNAYFNNSMNREIIERVSRECYLPTNRVLLNMIRKHPEIKVSFSISGVAINQLEEYAPAVLSSFRELANTGSVEFLAETYYHSLACMMPGKEFESQILKHVEAINRHFGVNPTVFRNTELIYNDEIGSRVSKLGFNGIITDGLERVLGERSPNHIFEHPSHDHLKILVRNYRLSDDIAFRYNQNGEKLSAKKYLSWLHAIPSNEEVVTLAMDYETFGEHHKKEAGIHTFLNDFLSHVGKNETLRCLTPSEAIQKVATHSALSVPQFISWADQERDLSAWLGNEMQRDAFDSLLKMEFDVKNLNDADILDAWRNFQCSDHFYYMSTKKGNDGIVHNYFSPYPSPYEAFINFMNVMTDFSMRVKVLKAGKLQETKTAVHTALQQVSQSMGNRMTMLSAR